jgi:uncharacterized membrane protein YphA (DoxX/SURF4 family)
MRPNTGLAGLLLRVGLAVVLSSWAYDIVFNPVYYAHVLHGLQQPVMVLLFGLAAMLALGFNARLTGIAIALMLVTFGLTLEGHQPIGLPQNYGLAAGALALAILGPGHLAVQARRQRPLTKRDVLLAATVLRAGLALTFLIYAVFKFTNADEYRIVVAETPVISAVAAAIGVQTTVNLVGVLEVAMAFLMMPGISGLWGALFQACALSSFLLVLGYPFSFPQDLGLIGIIGGLACVQTIKLPLVVRRAPAGIRLSLAGLRSGSLGLDGRGLQAAPSTAGAVVYLRLDNRRSRERAGTASSAELLEALGAVARDAVRPSDTCTPNGADGYYVLAAGVTTRETLDAVLSRLQRRLTRMSAEVHGCPPIGVGAYLWNPAVPLLEAMTAAAERANSDVRAERRYTLVRPIAA